MARAKTRYVCQDCGHTAHRWMGRCPECEEWNTLVEEVVPSGAGGGFSATTANGSGRSLPVALGDVAVNEEARIRTGVAEFDRVLGGGIMQGSLILLAGDPGIGKSTLMTELGKHASDRRILYVTGEESVRQVKLRASRLGVHCNQIYLLAETSVEAIAAAARNLDPDIMIVDSIQTVFRADVESAPGTVSQVRESTAALMQVTKEGGMATFLVGHVTKQGSIAGPRVLEHMVDTVLHFEGDRHHAYRILRSVKNRFGPTNEIGVFEMKADGLAEVGNPSEVFLSDRNFDVSGSTVICAMEGTRPLLVEIQALVTGTSYGTPQRTATGYDARRLQMLIAVLEKREGLRLSTHDVFVNAVGGVRLDEPAVDLGVVVALASSFRDRDVDRTTLFVGEVGLGGELRSVPMLEPRLREAAKLGFQRAVVPASGGAPVSIPSFEVLSARRLSQVLDWMT